MTNLKHVGVVGMRWGTRRGSSGGSSGGGKRKTSFLPTDADGRTVNKLFGKRNRVKIRNFLLGDPDKFIKKFPGMKKKYSSLSKTGRVEMKRRVTKGLATVSILSIAALGLMLKGKG